MTLYSTALRQTWSQSKDRYSARQQDSGAIAYTLPKVRGGVAKLYHNYTHEIILHGGFECVAGETHLYNPDDGSQRSIQWYYDNQIAPTVLTQYGNKKAAIPFRKGIAALYRVTLENGSSVIGTLGHRILTPGGWTAIRDLSICHAVCTYSPNPHLSSSELDPLAFRPDGCRCEEIVPDYRDDYSVCSRPCDEQLPLGLDNALVHAPSQGGAHEHIHAGHTWGGHGSLSERSHPHQLCDHLSSDRSVYHDDRFAASRDHAEYSRVQYVPLLACRLSQQPQRFLSELLHQQPCAEVTHHFFDKHFVSPFELPPSFNYTVLISAIASIEYVRTDAYYDLHVPGAGHYFAEGIWHHNTGKTYGILGWLHYLNCQHPSLRQLWVRSTYKSLVGSVCETFEHKVLVAPPGSPNIPVTTFGGERPEKYRYSNGSEVLLGGLDRPDKFLSAEFDVIYINQCEDIDLNAYEMLLGRATGRAANVEWSQIVGDCNPSYPGHWILQRHQAGYLELYQQNLEDNPTLFDDTGQPTERGQQTLLHLDSLTGVRYQRGRLGLWVQAEGAIFDNFSYEDNVTEAAEYDPRYAVFWGVDDGYAYGDGPGSAGYHPRAVLLFQQRHDGAIQVFDEYYEAMKLPEQTIDELLERPYHKPRLCLVDSSAVELRRRLADRGLVNAGNTHVVSEGIKVMRRYICDGHGVRQLFVHPRCKNFIRETQGYRYDPNSHMVAGGEPKPLKLDDHLIDAARYGLWNFR